VLTGNETIGAPTGSQQLVSSKGAEAKVPGKQVLGKQKYYAKKP
jgi:hypothetical protein